MQNLLQSAARFYSHFIKMSYFYIFWAHVSLFSKMAVSETFRREAVMCIFFLPLLKMPALSPGLLILRTLWNKTVASVFSGIGDPARIFALKEVTLSLAIVSKRPHEYS